MIEFFQFQKEPYRNSLQLCVIFLDMKGLELIPLENGMQLKSTKTMVMTLHLFNACCSTAQPQSHSGT